MIAHFHDDFKIDENFNKIKYLIEQVEKDLYKFIGPTRNRKAGIRARKKMIKISSMAHQISIGVMHQGQIFDSDYSGH